MAGIAKLPQRAGMPFRGTFFGEWEIRAQLSGERGMHVCRAWNNLRCEAGTLTLLDPSHSRPDLIERFGRRRDAMLRLRHPCVLTMLDHGDEPLPFLVDEVARAGTLKDQFPLFHADVRRTLRMARDVALGLGAAHAQGYIHRDVSLESIHLLTVDHAAIGNFGVAHSKEAQTITQVGERVGSRPFSAPEHVRSQSTPAFDVFGLGAVIHAVLSGKARPERPYAVRRAYEPLATRGDSNRLRRLDQLLGRMLSLDALGRPASMTEVIEAIDALM